MKPKRLLIVGGVAGGASAAARARRLSESAKIIVFERGQYVSFANCGLPYHIGGEIPDREELLVQTPEQLRSRFNLDVRIRHEVTAIDRGRRAVRVRDLEQGAEYEEPYDALILSPGAEPIVPNIPNARREGHFTIRTVPDADAVNAWIARSHASRAVVVGAGYIGLEMTEQLVRRGLKVSVVEALPQVFPALDFEMAAFLARELRERGVDLHLQDPVVEFEPSTGQFEAAASIVVLQSGKRLPADIVILAVGVRPETALAREAGLELGELGGIRVNKRLRTSDPAIWAVGDAIEVKHLVTGQWRLIPLAGPANRQGRTAADNIFGRPSEFRGVLGTSVARVFGLVAGCVGAKETELRAAGIPYETVHLHPPSHADYYPGAHPISLKLAYHQKTGKVLGAQAVGRDGVDKRIDAIAVAIQAGMTVDDLAQLDLAYAPPFGSAKDPVNLAGMAAQNVFRGDVAIAHWDDIDRVDPARQCLLDVRTLSGWKSGHIPGAIHIPLDDLRQRLAELPKEMEIIVYCDTGYRSYFACRILQQHGFNARSFTGSYRTWHVVKEAEQCREAAR
ncbi:MAG: FAD-dependent oxidoreductase [Verrucomicrobia bacterium]|nr:FAD-dependent oxidoreductase [Verrucomicrobiota bacterium]